MSTDAERQTQDEDVQAFFALSRGALYGAALGLLALALGAAAAAMALGPIYGLWVVPLFPALAAAVSAVLRSSAAGRGALWTLSRKGPVSSLSPTQTVVLWSVLALCSAAAAWLLER